MSSLAWAMAAFIAVCLLAAIVCAAAWRRQRNVWHRRDNQPRRRAPSLLAALVVPTQRRAAE